MANTMYRFLKSRKSPGTLHQLKGELRFIEIDCLHVRVTTPMFCPTLN